MLTLIIFGFKLSSIGMAALSYCTSLTDVSFGNSSELLTIGNMAFTSDTSLETIWLPASLTSIGTFSFAGTGLTSAVLQSESVIALQSDSFDYENVDVYVPDSILSDYQTTYSDPGYNNCFQAIIV